MSESKENEEQLNGALTRMAGVLEAAQFDDGSLNITLQGPESGFVGSPLVMKLFITGDAVDKLTAELSGIGLGRKRSQMPSGNRNEAAILRRP
jgi:hypothetical protein